MKTFVSFAVGFGAGWAVRSLADSPHGVGVKVMEAACRAKGHLDRWFAVERERIADMFAEARSKSTQTESLNSSETIQKAA